MRDWIYVDDHNRGIAMILEKGKLARPIVSAGAGGGLRIPISPKKILALVGKNESWIEYVKDRPGHDFRYAIDYSKARSEARVGAGGTARRRVETDG